MNIPRCPNEIRAEREKIEAELVHLEAQVKFERSKLKILRDMCPHPEDQVERWHSKSIGWWTIKHFKCNVCGLHNEDRYE